MDAKLVFFKNAFSIFVRQSYCGVQFVSSTLCSRCLDFWTSLDTLNSSSFRMFTFTLLSSRNCWILREKEDIVPGSHILKCPFSLQLYKNCTADCPALLGGFPRSFVFTHSEISEIRSYRRLFSSRCLPVVGS